MTGRRPDRRTRRARLTVALWFFDDRPAPARSAGLLPPRAMPSYRSVFHAGLFAGQVAVVTGGGSGIGRCTAHELAALGAAVAIVGRNADKLEARARARSKPTAAPSARRTSATSARKTRVRRPSPRCSSATAASTASSTTPAASSRRRSRRSARRAGTRSSRNNLTGGFLSRASASCSGWRRPRRRHRQHHRRHVGRHAGHGPFAARRAPAC